MSVPATEPGVTHLIGAITFLIVGGGLLGWVFVLLRFDRHWVHTRQLLEWAAWRPVPAQLPGQLVLLYLGLSLVLARMIAGAEITVRTTLYGSLLTMVPLMLWCGHSYRRQGMRMVREMRLERGPAFGTLMEAFCGYAMCMPLVIGVASLQEYLRYYFDAFDKSMQPVFEQIAHIDSWSGWAMIVIAAVVIAPLAEELLFRGVVFPWISARLGVGTGMVASSLLFALVHNHLGSILPLTVLAMGLCVAYCRTRSLWAPILIHALFNGLALLQFALHPMEAWI